MKTARSFSSLVILIRVNATTPVSQGVDRYNIPCCAFQEYLYHMSFLDEVKNKLLAEMEDYMADWIEFLLKRVAKGGKF